MQAGRTQLSCRFRHSVGLARSHRYRFRTGPPWGRGGAARRQRSAVRCL